jgi:hypothetical protein
MQLGGPFRGSETFFDDSQGLVNIPNLPLQKRRCAITTDIHIPICLTIRLFTEMFLMGLRTFALTILSH